MNLYRLKTENSVHELLRIAAEWLENMARSRKQDVIFSILKRHAKGGEDILWHGILGDSFKMGLSVFFLRSPDWLILAGGADIYSITQAKYDALTCRTGDTIAGKIRPP